MVSRFSIFHPVSPPGYFDVFPPSGVTAEDRQTTHYRLKHDSLCLQVNMPADSDDIWSFNQTVIVYKKQVEENFVDKVDYDPKKLSSCINKLTEADSGIYTIDVVHLGKTLLKKTFTHRLKVQGKNPNPLLVRLARRGPCLVYMLDLATGSLPFSV